MKHAKQAYQLASVMGYPSVSEMINLVEDGNISGIPGITRVDIKRAYEINGEPVAYMCEKNDQEELLRVHFSKELKATEKDQVMQSDVMTIDGNFVVGVSHYS